jgi:aldose sugar dehydrogenase
MFDSLRIYHFMRLSIASPFRRVEVCLNRNLIIIFALFFMSLHIDAQDTFTDSEGVTYRVEKFMDANFPVGMTFTDNGELFYVEKTTGNVRYIDAEGNRQPEPVITFVTDALQERGMQSIRLDPDYENNGYVWVFYTAEGTRRDFASNKVVRFHVVDGIGSDPVEMLSVPIDTGNLLHNGGGLAFDAEGYLYIGVGDYGDTTRPQNLDLPQGKIHRFAVDDDALVIPDNNPFEDSSIYAYGLRNPFDYDFDPVSGRPFATENGDNCDDEVNLILAGFNYGYRDDYECAGTKRIGGLTRYLSPILSYTPTIAPAGILFYRHPDVPQWENDLFFCSWNDGVLHRVRLTSGRNQVESETAIDMGSIQCRIDITMSPDGGLYFGSVDSEGGAIYRLIPE